MLGISWLMISDVRYPSFKSVDWKTRGSYTAILGAVVLVSLTIHFRYIMPVVLFSAYLIYGFFRPWISQRLRKEIEEFSESDENPTTPSDKTKES
jgi:CDP-diacylglycerol--serine O-phosphatidyltransferase